VQPVVLSQAHVTVIRAALKFWQEENGPEAGGLLQTYSEAADDDLPSTEQVQWLMDQIGIMQLRYVAISPQHLHQSPESALQAVTEQNAIVCSVPMSPTPLP